MQDPLRRDGRALGSQIDLLVAATVFIAFYAVFLATAPIIIDAAATPASGTDKTAKRVSQTLVDDLLVRGPDNDVIDFNCAAEFFTATTAGDCGFPASWSTDGEFLYHSTGVEPTTDRFDRNLNITVERAGSIVSLSDGTELKIGESPSESASVSTYRRFAPIDTNDDDAPDQWVTLKVRVW